MALNTDLTLGQQCSCRKVVIEVQCEDCTEYRATCHWCWIEEHSRYTWWHWALVWNREGDFFQCFDFSRVDDLTTVIQFSHNRRSCPNLTEPILLIHVHFNGIHSSHFQFCRCKALPEGLPYKEEARHIQRTQLMQAQLFPASAKRATMAFSYQVMKAFQLQHLEGKISMYNFVGALRWLGQTHGIDEILTHRPPGNLIVCHLSQLSLLLDSNFHMNKLKKKPEADDISLFEGHAYYPHQEWFKEYLHMTWPTKEKSICNDLKVVNTQNKQKFVTMEQSGVVNATCNHVCIQGTVDLQLGEQFQNTDVALLQVLKLHMHRRETCNLAIMLSYDCNCSYHKNLGTRFEAVAFEEVSSYLKCNGHNHGEGIEQYWVLINSLGYSHHSSWGPQLEEDVQSCPWAPVPSLNIDELTKRKELLLKANESNPDKEESNLKPESQKEGPELLKNDEGSDMEVPIEGDGMVAGNVQAMIFLYEGILLENEQYMAALDDSERDAIDLECERLGIKITQWYREASNPSIADVWDKVFETSAPVPETCKLLLPSAMSEVLHQKLGFTDIVQEEYDLCEGAAYDAITEVQLKKAEVHLGLTIQLYNAHQLAAKKLGAHLGKMFLLPELTLADTFRKMRTRKRVLRDSRKADGKVFGNLRKGSTLAKIPGSQAGRSIEFVRTQITQKRPQDFQGPRKIENNQELTEQDPGQLGGDNCKDDGASTKHTKISEISPDKTKKTEDGWIWNLYKIHHPGMSDKEVEQLEQEGDCVIFFHTEAERDWWLEQWEIKIAEFLRCIRSFDQYASTWTILLLKNTSPGFSQYAMEKAYMYTNLGIRAKQEFQALGYGNVLYQPTDQMLEDFLIAQWKQYEDEPDD
ncbi:hypothetical protein IW262DRAFT_1293640 [Armillaria fumosa]|nr:hypothetical protein IW262DRAFT_1293640 [Armillaria fumosa]